MDKNTPKKIPFCAWNGTPPDVYDWGPGRDHYPEENKYFQKEA
jgi:hypothetical protein